MSFSRLTALVAALAAVLAAVLVVAPRPAEARAVFVCDTGGTVGEVTAEGDSRKYARISWTHVVDYRTGETQRLDSFVHPERLAPGETVAAYAYTAGAAPSTTKQAKVSGHVLDQVKRSAELQGRAGVRIECSDTPIAATAAEITRPVRSTSACRGQSTAPRRTSGTRATAQPAQDSNSTAR